MTTWRDDAHPDFIAAYNSLRGPRTYTIDQFLTRLDERLVRDPSGCWIWSGPKTDEGYGRVTILGGTSGTHRVTKWVATGVRPPEGMHVDHLCRVPSCANPSHLEVVTPRTNLLRSSGITAQAARQTACIHGHEYTPENVYITSRGGRACRECHRIRRRVGYVRPMKGDAA